MTHSELFSELCRQFEEYRREYDRLDEEIEGTLDVAHRIIFSAPRDDFFSAFTPSIVCEEFNSDFVCEAFLSLQINEAEYFIQFGYDAYCISYENKNIFDIIYTSEGPEFPTEMDFSMIYQIFSPLLQK